MVGKKSGKALLKEEGLERTDNGMEFTIWPQVGLINQKNYYTEYLKRDDQSLAFRLQNDETRDRMARAAKDKDRALAHSGHPDVPLENIPAENGEDGEEEAKAGSGEEMLGSKVIVIHLGSQNLRIGLSSDALPKTIPMVIARKSQESESEENGAELNPLRAKSVEGEYIEPEKRFGDEFASQFNAMSAELRMHMRNNKRRVLPTSKELVLNYNRRSTPEKISEHNDPLRIDWTELPPDPNDSPAHFTGHAALRIPDNSTPRYKLYWPLRCGWYNERDYSSKSLIFNDISVIIEDAIRNQLNLRRKREWAQYDCVFVIPDLYDRLYVTESLNMLMRDFNFARVCFFQESVAATFGAGVQVACVVDIGAQKTSICCVEDGMCVENSRINLKYGGADTTEALIKMLLFDHFPYEEINLKRRYDFLLAEELKHKFCTMKEADTAVQTYDFHLRAWGQDTRKYLFKTYDEVILAPMGYYNPSIFDNERKLLGRRKLIERSYDIYDGSPNDPLSEAQLSILAAIKPLKNENEGTSNPEAASPASVRQPPINFQNRFNDNDTTTPQSSAAGSPAPDGTSTPIAATGSEAVAPVINIPLNPIAQKISSANQTDCILPVFPLDAAIITSIEHAARDDEGKTKDYLANVMVVGGGSKFPGLCSSLEERVRALKPGFSKDIIVAGPLRDLDPQVTSWKGASVWGKIGPSNDSWITQIEYDRLGSRMLVYKCQWLW
ncbi:MAG: actin-like protein arp8 [Trizodia sp. TS-e1964]|nr:MAG: actin-like protein arp8 [Trizodia sp. TS-e1964]